MEAIALVRFLVALNEQNTGALAGLSGSRWSVCAACSIPRAPVPPSGGDRSTFLALELQEAALLAIVPTATVEREITLAPVQVDVVRHKRNNWLAGQVRELPC